MSAPSITVLLPVYNAEAYLREAVESILSQSFIDFELLVMDDGCTDGSVDVVRSYADPRIRLIQNPVNLGLIGTLNRGIAEARGRYMVRQDADDISLPHRLQKLFDFMESNPDVAICGSWYDGLTDGNRHAGVRYAATDATIRLKHFYQIHISHGTSIWRTATFREKRWQFDPDFRHAEDYDLFVRASFEAKLANLTEVLYVVRYHGESVSQQHRAMQTTNSSRVIKGLFAKLGVTVNDADVQAVQAICYGEYGAELIDLKRMSEVFDQWANAAANGKYIDKKVLIEFLAAKWFHLCYNRRADGSYRVWAQNSLSTKSPDFGNLARLKFWLRSMLHV